MAGGATGGADLEAAAQLQRFPAGEAEGCGAAAAAAARARVSARARARALARAPARRPSSAASARSSPDAGWNWMRVPGDFHSGPFGFTCATQGFFYYYYFF